MITLILITFIVTFIIYRTYKKKTGNNRNGLKALPSVPGGLPIVGHMFNLGNRPYEYLTDIGDKLGPIFKIQIGWKEIIILNNYDIINKCLKEDGANFAGRWRNTFTDQLAKYCGLGFKEKEWWNAQRTFTLQALRDFGFGKSQTEAVIKREMEKIIILINSSQEVAISSADILSLATINVVSDFILSIEHKDTDLEVVNLIRDIRKVAQGENINTIFVNIFPIFKNFPNIENKIYILLDSSKVVETFDRIYAFIKRAVDEHRDNFDPNNECRDLIDAFLLEQHKLKELNTTGHSFVDFQLIRLIAELFLAGFETTSTTLTWAMLLLSKFPTIQQKMHDEIVANIGINRLPTMADKKSLPYFQAVMDEILRFVTLLPLSLPHRVFNDTTVNGFFIPGDSVIFPNLYACHRDPKVWEKPYDFYPEHFLDGDGKYNPRPELIPFGIGKRTCLGESLAKMEYFIFLATIIQRYRLSLDDESDKIDNFILFEGTGGIVRGPINHKIIFRQIIENDLH